MSFLLPIALLLGFLALAPILAHALRKGRAAPLLFPATHLVASHENRAKTRHRIEDKFLLLLRVLLILCLALLAASPLMQCSRLSLAREGGASMAAMLVIDDSGSMQALMSNGNSRLQTALERGDELLATSQPGDSFSIILAGKPARVITTPTTDIKGVREALASIQPSDRRTDLKEALNLARALQVDLPHKSRPIVLLSDLSVANAAALDLKGVVLPEEGLRSPLSNCALLSATASQQAILVEVACTSAEVLDRRKIEIVDAKGEAVAHPVLAQDGAVQIPIIRTETPSPNVPNEGWVARLTAASKPALDQLVADDQCPVLSSSDKLTVAIRADQSKAGVKTGSGTLLQAAVSALDKGVRVDNLSLLPERATSLDDVSAIFIDDPSGFTPEESDALHAWVDGGGVAVLLLGPGIESTPLGADFNPFVAEAPLWVKNSSPGVDPKKPGTLGPLTVSWNELDAPHRATLTDDSNVSIRARFDDGAPLIVEKILGRGLLITSSLPSSSDLSDFALRPAFVELVDYVLSQGALRRGALATLVGETWALASEARVRDPNGASLVPLNADRTDYAQNEQFVSPPIAGRYTIEHRTGGAPSHRFALRERQEQIGQPNADLKGSEAGKNNAHMAKVDISREIALLVLVLGALELAFRVFRRRQTLNLAGASV